VPLGGALLGAAVLAAAAWRWSNARDRDAAPPVHLLDPALEQRLDDELRRFEG
jgi:hypothetical protein